MSNAGAKNTGIASRWEWVAAAISALLVLGILAVLATGAVQDGEPPRINVHVDSVSALADGYLAHLEVSNEGTAAAADLVIQGELSGAGAVVETSTVTLDYVPGSGHRAAGLFFRRDPRAGTLRIRPVGYRAP